MWGIRVIPAKHQQRLLMELHRDHPGCSRMKSIARSYIWWPGVDVDIEQMAKGCTSCQQTKHAPPRAPSHSWTWPAKPWQRLHLDFAGPFMGTSFFVIIDAYFKWPEVFEMTTTSTAKTVAKLRELFAAYGLPEQIVTDNGPQFTSAEFESFVKGNSIKHTRCAPYHPASNGAVERFNQMFKQALKASANDGRAIAHRLADFLLTYWSTPHATTGRTPSSLFLQREIRTRFTLLQPDVNQQVLHRKASQQQQASLHAKPREFQEGQRVWVKTFRPSEPTWVQGTVIAQQGPLSYKYAQILNRYGDVTSTTFESLMMLE